MIPFNRPPFTGFEQHYVLDAINSDKISGDGPYSKKCHKWFENHFNGSKALLTTSCTHSLEMAALLLDIREGDEVIMPSYTFVSTANSFVLRGATIIFVDIRPDTMNIDEECIEKAITKKTKAIVPVHYAGVACEMEKIMDIAKQHDIYVVEDAAQAIYSSYRGKPLGTIGHIGALSFHETKNITSAGEGGLTIINDPDLFEKAEIIREKGTNRSRFFRGAVDKYTWVGLGSSYLMNDVSAAYLWGQLEHIDSIIEARHTIYNHYSTALRELEKFNLFSLSPIMDNKCHNAHLFYLKTKNIEERTKYIQFLRENGVMAAFHYVPLHSSPFGRKAGRFQGKDRYTTKESERLVRLPLFFGLSKEQVNYIVDQTKKFYVKEEYLI